MDGFHQKKDNIYVITIKSSPKGLPQVFEPAPYLGFDPEEYPEIRNFTTIKKYSKGDLPINYEDLSFSAEGLVTDTSFFNVFNFKLKVGDTNTILSDPDAILLTENFAGKIFGEENPIGKSLKIGRRNTKDFTVKGILENPPLNSSIEFDFILPDQYNDRNFFNRMGGSFILVENSFDDTLFKAKINQFEDKYNRFTESTLNILPFDYKEINKSGLQSIGIFSRTVNEKNLYIQIIIMLVILVISALNFSNLQVINTNSRLKNTALKLVIGANKNHILKQMLVELLIFVFVCTIITTIAYILVLPTFTNLTQIYISPSLLTIIQINCSVLLILSVIGMIYPLILGIRIPLIKSLKNLVLPKKQLKGGKEIVVFQYALTFLLLISSIVVAKQLSLMLAKDLGFKQKNIVSAQLWTMPSNIKSREEADDFLTKIDLGNNELAKQSTIKHFASGNKPIDSFTMDWKRKKGDFELETHNTLISSPDYEKVLGLKLLEGRFFDKNRDRSRENKVVINETAKKYWGIEDIDNTLMVNESWGDYEIIGVVKDFNYQHLASITRPLMMLYMKDFDDTYLIEFQDGAIESGLNFLDQFFKDQNPNASFSYTFLEDDVASLYRKEKQLSINYILFTVIALIISVIGLFTIALYNTRSRVKEIAIRKVNGAQVWEVISLLNKSFIKWVGLAFIIACPIAYVLMEKWLQNFAYKTDISWWIFALSGGFTLLIALLTVSWQSYKTAVSNPVNNLRTE
jgi:putative ABC transport system permease protein